MDLPLFASLIRNLLHLNVMYTPQEPLDKVPPEAAAHDMETNGDGDDHEDENSTFQIFQNKYCYHAALQPAFTARELSRLTSHAVDLTIYSLRDELGLHLMFFRFDGQIFLLGPYVHEEAETERIQAVLISHHFPASYSASIQLYYSAFPVLNTTSIQGAVLAMIHAFTGKSEEYTFCRLSADRKGLSVLPRNLREESLDYSTLYRRYDLENNFLHMIETGDTDHVLDAEKRMTMVGLSSIRYVNAYYTDPAIGFAMTRAMARKAAERGGASLVEIHEITQRAVQRTLSARNMKEQTRNTDNMILELTEAVRRSRMNLSSYSAPIRKVVEYLQLNSSQKISLSDLAKLAGLSESYLTKTFKAEVGSTISQYIAYLRCSQAADLLRNTQRSIQEISNYVGYEDNNYFVKVFRKQFNMTPSEYREKECTK